MQVDQSYLSFQTWKVNIAIWSGKWYYELKLGTMTTALQIGWLGLGCKAKPFVSTHCAPLLTASFNRTGEYRAGP